MAALIFLNFVEVDIDYISSAITSLENKIQQSKLTLIELTLNDTAHDGLPGAGVAVPRR